MRTALLLCLVGLLGVAGWLCFGISDASLPPTAPAVSPPVDRPAVDPGEARLVASEPATAADAASAREAAASVAAPASDAPPIPDDAKWLELTVIDGDTKAQAPGVDVWWTNELQWQRLGTLPRREQLAVQQEPDALALRFGWHARTDERGRVRVAPGKNGASVIARDATRYGAGYFSDRQDAAAEGHVLRLAIDRTLVAHVRDAAGGDAAGVPVGLEQHDLNAAKAPRFQGGNRLTSGADGVVRFAHVQGMATWNWGPHRGQPVGRLALGITTPGLEPTPVLLDPAALPEQPVELQLPATGGVEVRVVFEGRPVPALHNLLLHAGPRGSSDAANAAWTQSMDEDGIATFPHVPLGKTFFTGTHHWWIELQGPTAPGEVVRCTFDIADRVYALSGRLLTPDGQPLADQQVTARFDFTVMSGGAVVETDANGRFLWILVEPHKGEFKAEVKQLAFEQQPIGAAPLRCSAAPRELVVGRNELGDLRFDVDALVAGGTLVFDCERSSGVGLTVERFEASTQPGRDGRWRPIDSLQQAQHEDRRFEVRGAVEPGRYRLTVAAYGALPVEPVEFTPGAKDLEIQVACGTQLDATCLVVDGVDPDRLRATLVPQQPESAGKAARDGTSSSPWNDPQRGQSLQLPTDAAGHARFRWLAAANGTHTLRIAGLGAKPLVEIPDVVVPPPAGGDPRLVDIDLRAALRLVRVKAHLPANERQGRSRAYMFVLPGPDTGDWRACLIPADGIEVPVPADTVDLLFAADYCKPVTVRGVERDVEVTLQPWPSVALQFAGIDALPEDVQLLAGIERPRRPEDRRRYDADYSTGPLDSLLELRGGADRVKDGTATLQLDDGVHQLRILVLVGRRTKRLEQVTPREVVAGAPVTVQLSAAEIQKVAAELRALNAPKKE